MTIVAPKDIYYDPIQGKQFLLTRPILPDPDNNSKVSITRQQLAEISHIVQSYLTLAENGVITISDKYQLMVKDNLERLKKYD